MSIPLEDQFSDIVGKAMRGLRLTDSDVAARAGVSAEAVQRLCGGDFEEAAARQVAPVLGLNAGALVASAGKAWRPEPITLEGLAQFNTPFEDMTVNSYLVWDSGSRQAAAFDTGTDVSEMIDLLQERELTLRAIFLTHTHGDHVFELDRLKAKTGAPAFVGTREPLDGARLVEAGTFTFELGQLHVETRLTWGHSKGGITYVISGLSRPVAIVGDAVFAGSMGGGGVSYEDALSTNREQILTLPEETVLCPGHGPLTTVAEEKRHNPFFA